MRKIKQMKSLFFGFFLIVSNLISAQQSNVISHKLTVNINPETSEINAIDSITISDGVTKEFFLNAALTPSLKSKTGSLEKSPKQPNTTDIGMDRDNVSGKNNLKITQWKITGTGNSFVITYSGRIESEIKQSPENYQRGFSQSPGIICNKGVYLAGSTYWTPTFKNSLVTFSLTTTLPKDWKTVSQGKRSAEKTDLDSHLDTWVCNKPQEEIFLIAAKFHEYTHDMNNGVKAMAFLRSPDEELANKYLEVTGQYMNMDNEMIGKYPYSKFALVENFWETGYGMPSFTLLGEKIIRFPFILHSSYPHELLHNWWGNSVYVDFTKGNWCEGITAFMADHLIKEQRGQGEEYRRSTLQKFTNLVNKDNDFPLCKFIGRYNGVSEAIGYGKALMMWQMLRRKLGDKVFLKGIQLFYKDYRFTKAGYPDIQKAMETVSNTDLSGFFNQWINRTGAPKLAIKTVNSDLYGGKYRINLTLEQQQTDSIFIIDVPVNIATEKGLETFVFNMNQRTQTYQIPINGKPLKLAIDPQYDVFRLLDPNEVPPTLTKIWGSKNNIIVLPSKTDKTHQAIYDTFAKQWKASANNNFTIVYDNKLKTLPTDKTSWIFGIHNKFITDINNQMQAYHTAVKQDSIKMGSKTLPVNGNDFIITVFNEKDINHQNIFIAIDNAKAIPGLIRKLPHYGKYSFLAFTGNDPTNIHKGQWSVVHSPMEKVFTPEGKNAKITESRQALGTLKPVFSEKRMMETIKFLSSDELKGRGLGTPELKKATEYIEGKMKEAGLQPFFNGSYLQSFSHTFKNKGSLKIINVAGIIQGTDPVLEDYPVVISAHYDHLGFGWPDVHKGDEGKIHHGADDNASGISILLELAKTMGKTAKPKRTIIFLACSGEEAGLIGSRYFVAHRKEYIKGKIFADVNLDTDGSLFDKKLLVLNANTAKEWKFIFMGTDYTTGVKSEVIDKQLDASDQTSFIEQGIPAIQLFTGATENYHRPTDTYDKIDGKGLVKVATVTKEVIEYLSNRTDPMHYTGLNSSQMQSEKTENKTTRKVSTGSVPAFDYTGKGVKIGAVIPNSAGEKAGLKANDIIVGVNGKKIETLKQYSDKLKECQPGDIINLEILRNGKKKKIKLKLEAR